MLRGGPLRHTQMGDRVKHYMKRNSVRVIVIDGLWIFSMLVMANQRVDIGYWWVMGSQELNMIDELFLLR